MHKATIHGQPQATSPGCTQPLRGGAHINPPDRSTLIDCGWKTAEQIITHWNAQKQRNEYPTLAGHMLASLGKHTDATLRTTKVHGQSCLYSPAAQALIWDALEKRDSGRPYRTAGPSANKDQLSLSLF